MLKKLKSLFFFDNKSIRGTIFKNFFWLLFGNAGGKLLSAIIVIYAARKLGAGEYGFFSYIVALASFFTFFKNIGIDSILTREVSKKPEERHIYFSTAFLIELVLLIITILLILFVAPLFSKFKLSMLILSFTALIFVFSDLRDFLIAFFRGIEKMELEAGVIVTGNLSLIFFGFLLLYFWPNAQSFIIANALSSFIGFLAAAFLLKFFVRNFIKNFKKDLVRPFLKSALPIAIGGISGAFLFNIDIVMLGWWRSAQEIGLYSAAQKIVGILALFSGFIATVTLPTMSRFVHSDKGKMIKIFEGAVKIIFVVAIPLVIGGIILKDSLVVFIFGSNYLLAANAFAILIVSILALHPLSIFYNFLFAFDKQGKAIKYALISSLSNFILNFSLIPSYGMLGSAIATTISFFIYIILMWREVKKIHRFSIVPGLLKPFAAAIIMGISVYFLKSLGMHVLINIAISSAVYFFILYILKESLLNEIFSFLRPGIVNFIKK